MGVYQHRILWTWTVLKQGIAFTFPTAWLHFMSLCGILVIFMNFCVTISFVVCDIAIVIVMGSCEPHPYKMEHREILHVLMAP